MVVVGLTVLSPSTGKLAPPLIDMLSASVVNQLKVASSPAVIVVGAAEKLSTLGAGVGGGGLEPVTEPTPEMPSQVSPWLD